MTPSNGGLGSVDRLKRPQLSEIVATFTNVKNTSPRKPNASKMVTKSDGSLIYPQEIRLERLVERFRG